jgi:hypothetical protein
LFIYFFLKKKNLVISFLPHVSFLSFKYHESYSNLLAQTREIIFPKQSMLSAVGWEKPGISPTPSPESLEEQSELKSEERICV